MTRSLPLIGAIAAQITFAGGLELPRKGCVVDASGGIRTLYGIRSNFVLGEPAMVGAVSAACSQRYIVARTELDVRILDPTGAPLASCELAGAAVIGFAADAIYVAASQGDRVFRWQANQWRKLPITIDGEILAIAGRDDQQPGLPSPPWAGAAASMIGLNGDIPFDGEQPRLPLLPWRKWHPLTTGLNGDIPFNGEHLLLVRRDDGVWLVRFRNSEFANQEWIAGEARSAVLWSDGTMLLAGETTVTVRGPDGVDRVHDLGAAIRSIGALSDGWAHIELENRRLALELAPGGDRFYVLPGETP
jgi:hypothetical protein